MKVIRLPAGYEIQCSDSEFDILCGSVNVSESEQVCYVPGGWKEGHAKAQEERCAGGEFMRVDEDRRAS